MGMDLIGENDETRHFKFSHAAWSKILELAHDFGWSPSGCEANKEYRKPTDRYFYNDGSLVAASEALEMAHALERALAGGLNVGREREYRRPSNARIVGLEELMACLPDGARFVAPVPPDQPPEVFYAAHKDKVGEFIAFCRSGGFRIY